MTKHTALPEEISMSKNAVSGNYRNEWKYICPIEDWYYLEGKLKKLLHRDSHASENGSYRVHSLYFDDLTDSCMTDNDSGNSLRSKYRIRYYGDSPAFLRLECKRKINGKCLKLSSVITTEQYHLLAGGHSDELFGLTEDPVLKKLCLCFSQKLLTPRIIISYDRTAYIEEITNVRITYDSNICVSQEINRFLTGDFQCRPITRGTSVLEVKFDSILPGYLSRIISEKNPQVTAFSKYYLGRQRFPVPSP